MEQRKYYRTIVLSDIHLGTSHSKTDEVCHFLSNVDCGRLILNGDIIDGWHLKKSGMRKWQPYHTRFFKILMKMMERKGTQVVYVRGNHDDFLDIGAHPRQTPSEGVLFVLYYHTKRNFGCHCTTPHPAFI